MISLPITVRRPITLSGYSGFYTTVCHPDMQQTVTAKGTPSQQSAFNTRLGEVMRHINRLQEFQCEVAINCEIRPGIHLVTGHIEAWSDSLVPAVQVVVGDIRRAIEDVGSWQGESIAFISLAFSRTVKRGQAA
jgi:hypothetical protein